jgi:hypothetical protein
MRQFRLLYICLSEQQHMTLGFCTSVGCLYLAFSFARRKTHTEQSSRNRTTGLPPLAHYVHIPCETNTKSALNTDSVRQLGKVSLLISIVLAISPY